MKNILIGVLVVIVALGAWWYFAINTDSETTVIKLFYYSLEKDTNEEGMLLCSREGLVAVEREAPIGVHAEDAVRLLLEGRITAPEKDIGITTEFPLEGLSVEKSILENGVLTLTLDDPLHKTVGGSCRASVLWRQIEATALQFSDVREVRFEPEELFQP